MVAEVHFTCHPCHMTHPKQTLQSYTPLTLNLSDYWCICDTDIVSSVDKWTGALLEVANVLSQFVVLPYSPQETYQSLELTIQKRKRAAISAISQPVSHSNGSNLGEHNLANGRRSPFLHLHVRFLVYVQSHSRAKLSDPGIWVSYACSNLKSIVQISVDFSVLEACLGPPSSS